MLNINQLVAFALCIKRITTASWVKHNDTSLTWDDASAVGVYNDTIFIIGGYRKTRQVTEYQWTTASYTVKQSDVLNEDIHGTAQFWAQKQHILYLIQPTGDAIATYDMQTEQLTTDVYTIPTDVTSGGCLAATDHHLYVIGGYHYTHLDTVQILDFSTEEWTNGPSMRKTRESLACITHNDYLWAFGGTQETSERISMNPISQNAWQYIDSFQYEVYALRCVAWEETIYIIGMRCYSNCDGEEYWAMVKTVDSVTGTITTLADAAPYASASASPIIVDDILYVFGGTRSRAWPWNPEISEMYYYILPTDNPTKNPTKSPTQTQSNNPTKNPTKSSTKNPTKYPTELSPVSSPTTANTAESETIGPDGQNHQLHENSGGSMNGSNLLTAVLVGLGCVIVAVCAVGWIEFYVYRRKQEEENKNPFTLDKIHCIPLESDGEELCDEIYIVSPPNASQRKKMKKMNASVLKNEAKLNRQLDDLSSGSESIAMHARIEKQMLATVGGNNGKEMSSSTSEYFEDNDVVIGEGEYGLCNDCFKHKLGKVDDGNGLFYCDECWCSYEEAQKIIAKSAVRPGEDY
eukprot:126925_1